MALLDILIHPDRRLRTVADAVAGIDSAVQTLIDDMFETMYDAAGIGLAATQVDVHRRLVVLDLSEAKNAPLVLINPEILSRYGEVQGQEGCLSIPGVYETVSRAERVTLSALDRDGQAQRIEADGLLAVAVQHEIDHLDGKLFVDYLSPLKRDRIRKKLLKLVRESD